MLGIFNFSTSTRIILEIYDWYKDRHSESCTLILIVCVVFVVFCLHDSNIVVHGVYPLFK